LHTPLNVLIERFQLSAAPPLQPRYNIAPTQLVAAVRRSAADGARHMALLKWGLVPSWARDAQGGARLINARGETVAEKPTFRGSFRHRRCLIPADGYYEWQRIGTRKQPYYFHLRNHQPFAFAGLWDTWHPAASDEPPLESCAIITTAANELCQPFHDRMPVILRDEDWDVWLNNSVQDRATLEPLLRPFDSTDLTAEAVSTYVNQVRHDDERCIWTERDLF
jgi:putative SOS response-associated peptidase YedK